MSLVFMCGREGKEPQLDQLLWKNPVTHEIYCSKPEFLTAAASIKALRNLRLPRAGPGTKGVVSVEGLFEIMSTTKSETEKLVRFPPVLTLDDLSKYFKGEMGTTITHEDLSYNWWQDQSSQSRLELHICRGLVVHVQGGWLKKDKSLFWIWCVNGDKDKIIHPDPSKEHLPRA